MRRAVAPLLAALLATPAGGAAPAGLDCQPLDAAPVRAPAIPHGRGLLFRLSRPGVAASHVFGTVHLDPPGFATLPAPVDAALAGSGTLVLEVLLEPAAAAEFAGRMFAPAGRSLEQRVGTPLWTAAVPLLERHGVPAEIAQLLQPWAAYVTLSLPPPGTGVPHDLRLMEIASARGLALRGLETIAEQARVFEQFAGADEIRLLTDSVCHYDELQRRLAELVRLYLARDLAAVAALADASAGADARLHARVMDALLFTRNARMAQRLADTLAQGRAFVAVGALHLPGERGLLALLERAGWTVERVY